MSYDGPSPEYAGIGIGATPGSTAGLTFDGSNFMDFYIVGTWTPTLDGLVSGTTTYTTQTGYYTKIGNIVRVFGTVVITGATGTGQAQITNLPFTVKTQANGQWFGSAIISSTGWTWPVGRTQLISRAIQSGTVMTFAGTGSTTTGSALQMANAAATFIFSVIYQV